MEVMGSIHRSVGRYVSEDGQQAYEAMSDPAGISFFFFFLLSSLTSPASIKEVSIRLNDAFNFHGVFSLVSSPPLGGARGINSHPCGIAICLSIRLSSFLLGLLSLFPQLHYGGVLLLKPRKKLRTQSEESRREEEREKEGRMDVVQVQHSPSRPPGIKLVQRKKKFSRFGTESDHLDQSTECTYTSR